MYYVFLKVFLDIFQFLFTCTTPFPPLDNIGVMVIVWRLRVNIIRTALCWIVWHNVHSQQHTYMSSSYRSNRLGLSHWDPYAMRRGSGLKLYYCNVVKRWLTYTVCGLSVAMGTVINWWADVVWQASVCQHTFLLLWNYTDVLFPNPTGAGFCQISNANFARARFSP